MFSSNPCPILRLSDPAQFVAAAALVLVSVVACGPTAAAPDPFDSTPAAIELTVPMDTVTVGDEFRVAIAVRNAAGVEVEHVVEWASSSPELVEVDAGGLIRVVDAPVEPAPAVRVVVSVTAGPARAEASLVVRPKPEPTWCERQVTSASGPPYRKRFRVVDLGTLGGPSSAARGISNAGHVVGVSDVPGGGTGAFLWQDGQMHALPTPPDHSSVAVRVNSRGDAVGQIRTAGCARAVLWRGGELIDLRGEAASCNFFASGQAINEAGVVAFGDWGAFAWRDGQVIPAPVVGTLETWAINNRSEILLVSFLDLYPNTRLWDLGSGEVRGLPGIGGRTALGTAISDSSVVVGVAEITPGRGTSLYCVHRGRATDLRVTAGRPAFPEFAFRINDAGTILMDRRIFHRGEVLNVAELLDDPGWELVSLHDLNDRDQIVGRARYLATGTIRAVLLDPLDP